MRVDNISNPIVRGFNPDPSICRVADDYYLATSSFEYAPGVPLYHSRDLLSWKHVGYALPSPEHWNFSECRASLGVWAPTLRYIRGRFYVIATIATDEPWPQCHSNYYVSAPEIGGSWSLPVKVTDGGIDPDLFEDLDGRVYYSHNPGCKTAQIDLSNGQLKSVLKVLWEGSGDAYPEAPHIYHIGDYYYILLAEGGTGPGHCVTVARSRKLYGSYEECPYNPVLTNRGSSMNFQSTGHADLLQTADDRWYAVCLGVRDVDGISPLGRETFLMPVYWDNDWPIFGDNGRLASVNPAGVVPQNKVFIDDFSSNESPLFWNTRMGWGGDYIRRGNGKLALTPNGMTLDDDNEMAFLGIRCPDLSFRAEVTVDIDSIKPGQTAGITVFMDPAHYYKFALHNVGDGEIYILAEVHLGELKTRLANQELTVGGDICLNVEVQSDRDSFTVNGPIIFSYRKDGNREELVRGEWRLLGATIAGRHTGSYLALFAEGEEFSPTVFSGFRAMQTI